MLTRRALGPRRATVAPSEPGAWTDGVPTNPTVDPLPAPSVSVTRNDPAAEGIASTPTSRNWRTSVLPDAPPRGIWPTPMTLALNTGPGMRVGAIEGVGGESGWSRSRRLVLARVTAAEGRQPRRRRPTRRLRPEPTPRPLGTYVRPFVHRPHGRPGSSPHPIAHRHLRATRRPASKGVCASRPLRARAIGYRPHQGRHSARAPRLGRRGRLGRRRPLPR